MQQPPPLNPVSAMSRIIHDCARTTLVLKVEPVSVGLDGGGAPLIAKDSCVCHRSASVLSLISYKGATRGMSRGNLAGEVTSGM